MRILLSRFPKEIINKYNLRALDVDGWVYIEIRKGVYGLKQAGLLGNQLLQKTLGTLWILSSESYTWTLIVQNKTNSVLTYCGRFRREVCGK
jgi:hypothetical protein